MYQRSGTAESVNTVSKDCTIYLSICIKDLVCRGIYNKSGIIDPCTSPNYPVQLFLDTSINEGLMMMLCFGYYYLLLLFITNNNNKKTTVVSRRRLIN